MTRKELTEEIKNALQREHSLTDDMELANIEEWDSLSVLTIVSLYDRLFSIILKYHDIAKLQTVKDLIELVENRLD